MEGQGLSGDARVGVSDLDQEALGAGDRGCLLCWALRMRTRTRQPRPCPRWRGRCRVLCGAGLMNFQPLVWDEQVGLPEGLRPPWSRRWGGTRTRLATAPAARQTGRV